MRSQNVTLELLAGIVLAAAGSAALVAQEQDEAAAFDTTRPPQGTVRDATGKPIGGARVSFAVSRGSLSAMTWRDAILRTHPLPKVRSGRDGEFFVPLTHLHRLFSPANAGEIRLVVEKEGYHQWIEMLPNGLRGYLGSNVVLREIRKDEHFAVEVKNPKPGMWLRVHRFGGVAGSDVEAEWWYPVPDSGTVDAVLSFVPSPLTLGRTNYLAVPIGIEVQLLWPGRSTPPKYVGYGQKSMVIGDRVPNTKFVCVLRGADGKPPGHPRGLYRCPDGVSRWFPVDPENVVESSLLALQALEAESHVAANVRYVDPSEETITLAAIPDPAERVLELRNQAGDLVRDAQVYFFDLAHLPSHQDGVKVGASRARRRLSAEAGRVDLGGRTLPGPGFLLVHAPGYKPQIVFDPRSRVGTTRIDLGVPKSTGKVALTVVDDAGAPRTGVYVALAETAASYGAMLGGLPRTDASGRVELSHVPAGSRKMRLVGPGIVELTPTIRVPGSGRMQSRQTVHRARTYRILLVDGTGEPLPFRTVRTFATFVNNNLARIRAQLRTNSYMCSDSAGRILFDAFPEGVLPRVMDSLGTLLRVAPAPLNEDEPVNRVELVHLETALMPLTPGAPPVRESMIAVNRSTNRTLSTRPGCGAMLVRFPKTGATPTLSVYLRGAPPMRVTEEILAAARKKQGAGLLVVDQRKIGREVQFSIEGFADADPTLLRVELPGMNFARNLPYLYGNSGLRVERCGDHWRLGLRDEGAYEARVMHPDFLLARLHIPAGGTAGGKAGAAPLKIGLTRGTSIVFRLKSTKPLRPEYRFNLYVHTQANQMVVYQRETLGESNLKKVGGNTWELRLPFALEPAKYYFSIRVYNTSLNLSRKLFTIGRNSPVVIEVNRRTASVRRGQLKRAVPNRGGPNRAAPERAVPDTARLQQRLDRLKKSAAALRKMGKTDEKSKARLQKVLRDIEEQIATRQRELDRLEAARRKAQQEESKAADQRQKDGNASKRQQDKDAEKPQRDEDVDKRQRDKDGGKRRKDARPGPARRR